MFHDFNDQSTFISILLQKIYIINNYCFIATLLLKTEKYKIYAFLTDKDK